MLDGLCIASLRADVKVLQEALEAFSGDGGRMLGLKGDETLAACIKAVREYDPAVAMSLEACYSDKVARRQSLEKGLEGMRRAGLSDTRDFRQFEAELEALRLDLDSKMRVLNGQMDTARSRIIGMIDRALGWQEAASAPLRARMQAPPPTQTPTGGISQDLDEWVKECRLRLQ